MRCDVQYEELSRFAAGEIEAERTRELEEHLGGCQECRGRVRALGNLEAVLRALPRIEPSSRAILNARRALSHELRGGGTREIMTLEEVADYLRMSLDDLEEILGGLPAFELAGQIRVRRDRLIEWIEQREFVYVRRNIESSLARAWSGEFGKGVA